MIKYLLYLSFIGSTSLVYAGGPAINEPDKSDSKDLRIMELEHQVNDLMDKLETMEQEKKELQKKLIFLSSKNRLLRRTL